MNIFCFEVFRYKYINTFETGFPRKNSNINSKITMSILNDKSTAFKTDIAIFEFILE